MKKFFLSLTVFILTSIYIAGNYYLLYNLTVLLQIHIENLLIPALILALLFPAGEIARHYRAFNFITLTGSIYMGFLGISASFYVLKDLVYFLAGGDLRSLTIYATLIIILIFTYSLRELFLPPIVRQIQINTDKVKGKYRIVQISDLHLGYLKKVKWLEEIVERVNPLKPDLILITGDLIDCHGKCINQYIESLKNLSSKYGILTVPGNHDYFSGLENFHKFCRETGIELLENRCVTFDTLTICGIHDESGKYLGTGKPDLTVVRNAPDGNFKILLHHSPTLWREAENAGFDLMLSGHTHAGQIPPMELLVFLYYKNCCGMKKYGKMLQYTTSGTGTWGPPMRFLSRSEIALIEIGDG